MIIDHQTCKFVCRHSAPSLIAVVCGSIGQGAEAKIDAKRQQYRTSTMTRGVVAGTEMGIGHHRTSADLLLQLSAAARLPYHECVKAFLAQRKGPLAPRFAKLAHLARRLSAHNLASGATASQPQLGLGLDNQPKLYALFTSLWSRPIEVSE